MIGAVVYRLRAENSAWLPLTHGRFMHAAFFAALHELSPELSAYVHDHMNSKPFTVSELILPRQKIKKDANAWKIYPGTILHWRVTGLNEMMLQAMSAIPSGYGIQVGKLQLSVEKVLMGPSEHQEAGVLDEDELIAHCLEVPDIQEITFRFLSPVSFRYFEQDYPWPLPEYVFASLADKWNQNRMPFQLERDEIRQEAKNFLPGEWRGQSRRIFFTPSRGVLAFEGSFSYGLPQAMPLERRQMYLMLAQYAVFAGVGRMTAQGMGQTRIMYR